MRSMEWVERQFTMARFVRAGGLGMTRDNEVSY